MKAHSGKLIFQTKTPQHIIEVRETNKMRWIHFGGRSIQSAMILAKPHEPALPYLNPMLTGMFLLTDNPHSILLLGLGGGSIIRCLQHTHPDLHITAVEIEPLIVQVAQQFFQLPPTSSHFNIVVEDANRYLAEEHLPNDIILMDLYSDEKLPDILYESSFYEHCLQQLNENSWFIGNFTCDNTKEFLKIVHIVRRVFDNRTLCVSVKKYDNIIIFATNNINFTKKIDILLSEGKIQQLEYDLNFGLHTQAII